MTPRTYARHLKLADKHLCATLPALAEWIEEHGPCKLNVEWERSIFESLVRAVAHQQLHGKAAESILRRLCEAFPKESFPSPKQLAKAEPNSLRELGFSNAKVLAIQGIAQATLDKSIPDRQQAERLSDGELIASVSQLRGIGKWTVEMLLIFSLGRLDVMPIDDFGVKSGLMHLLNLPELPKKVDFAATDSWAPYRSVGAWHLWRIADQAKADAKSTRN
jgi:DNA-3-methyladenine glycosylase II